MADAVFHWLLDHLLAQTWWIGAKMKPQTTWGMLQLCSSILSIFHVVLSINPSWDSFTVVIPGIPRDIICIPLNEIVVVSIMVLTPIICSRSFLLQLRAKPSNPTFRTLFYESLFGSESQMLKSPIPILNLICIPLSLWYIWNIVHYIYYSWKIEFAIAQFFRPLILYPALFWVFQSIFQGCFLLWTFSVPTFAQQLKKQKTFQSDIQDYIHTNLFLLVLCICLAAIVTLDENTDNNIYKIAVGEIFYRALAVIALMLLKSKMGTEENHNDLPAPVNEISTSEFVPAESETCNGLLGVIVVSNVHPLQLWNHYICSAELAPIASGSPASVTVVAVSETCNGLSKAMMVPNGQPLQQMGHYVRSTELALAASGSISVSRSQSISATSSSDSLLAVGTEQSNKITDDGTLVNGQY